MFVVYFDLIGVKGWSAAQNNDLVLVAFQLINQESGPHRNMEKNETVEKKSLLHLEKHFQGYWVRLQAKIRRHDDTDDLLKGYLKNPLLKLREAWDTHHENPRPTGDTINALHNTGQSVAPEYIRVLSVSYVAVHGNCIRRSVRQFSPNETTVGQESFKAHQALPTAHRCTNFTMSLRIVKIE